jgi:hypothetical protein
MTVWRYFVKVFFVLILSAGVGLLFGILPCYLFPVLGIPGQWCGFKSEPPHFETQFMIGFLLTLAAGIKPSLAKAQKPS